MFDGKIEQSGTYKFDGEEMAFTVEAKTDCGRAEPPGGPFTGNVWNDQLVLKANNANWKVLKKC